MPLQIAQARNDLLSKLGIENAELAPALALQDVVVAINGAMQMLQRAGQQYFTQEQIEVALIAGVKAYPLDKAIQAVIGPVRLNDEVPLKALTSRGEFDQFDRIFLGSATYGAAQSTPIAYWPEFTRDGTTGDISLITIFVAPTPNAIGTLAVEVINDAPNYTQADLSSTAILPVAHSYTESIFLPIARMLITRSSQFSRPDLLRQLSEDYERAMNELGTGGGFPNVTQREPERRTTA